LVRPLAAGHQIISGHNRTTATRHAGLKQIPAWVREMDDDTAFMQLVLSNAQGELSPSERGMHALAATERGKHNGRSVKTYAELARRDQSAVNWRGPGRARGEKSEFP
jgi:ParB family chromosome partitioning protein